MLTRLTQRLNQTLYTFSKKPAHAPSYLPLYQSNVFKTQNFDDIFISGQAVLRYKQLLPILILSQSGLYPPFDPNNQVLKVVTLRAGGYHSQQFSIDTVIPWPYRDMFAQSKLPQPKLPTFIDDEMIYLNSAVRETIFCESDGQWNEQNVNHPKLSLQARFDEKEWFDRRQLF